MSTEAGEARPSGRRTGRIPFRYWVIIVLAVLAAIFIAQNRDHHPIHLRIGPQAFFQVLPLEWPVPGVY